MNDSFLELYLFCIGIFGLAFGYFYIFWKISSFKSMSKYGFITVHLAIFIDSIPRIFHVYLKKYIGLYGEYLIFRELEKIPGDGKILINLYLPQGVTISETEVDLVYIHESGIYIIESKDYAGWIYGNQGSKEWIQSFSKRIKYPFYNPILQNYSHIKSIEQVIGEYKNHIKGLIIFSNRSRLKITPNIPSVIQRWQLKGELRKYPYKLSKNEIDLIYTILAKYSIHSHIQEDRHALEIQGLIKNSF